MLRILDKLGRLKYLFRDDVDLPIEVEPTPEPPQPEVDDEEQDGKTRTDKPAA